jgi:VCBS repeat-containing protein
MAIINGNSGDNTLNGTAQADTIDGLGGDDTINGLASNDILRGGTGIDTVDGGAGDDRITGGTHNDTLLGGDGNDTFVFATGDGSDLYAGGAGTDRIVAAAAGTIITLRGGFGPSHSIEAIDGLGSSIIRGSAVADTYNFSATTLTGLASIDLGDGSDRLTGSSGADRVRGGLGNDTISGGGGADVLEGDDGTDTLDGGVGADRLIGGTGADVFAITTLSGGADRVADFGNGTDTLRLGVLPTSGVTSSNLASFVRAQRVDGNVVVRVDTNGTTGGSAFIDAAVLEGFTGTTVRIQVGSQFFNLPIASANRNPTLDDDAISVTEDTSTGNLLTTLLTGDTDPDGNALRVTAATQGSKGSVYFHAGTAAIGDETITYTANGAVLDALAPGETTTDTFIYTVSDGNGGIDHAKVTVTITAVNDRPVLNDPPWPRANPVNEDAGPPVGAVGTLVSQLVDLDTTAGGHDNVRDADGPGLGIAVGEAATHNGTWFFTLDGGSTWSNIGPVSEQSARLFAADANTRIYFQPRANYNSDDAEDPDFLPRLHFHAWDRDTGVNGGFADLTAHASAFSDSGSLALFAVTGVNDAPTNLELSSNEVVENVAGAVVGTLSALDPDSPDSPRYTLRSAFDGPLFTIVGNELRVGATPLDYEAAATRTVIVRAADRASPGLFVERTFTIEVQNRAEVTLTTGADVIAASAVDTQFLATALTLNSNDNLDAGAGFDSLVLTTDSVSEDPESFDLNALAGFSGFEEIRVVNYNTFSMKTLSLRNGTTSSVVGTGDGPGGGTFAVVLDGTARASSIQLQYSDLNRVVVGAETAWNPTMTIVAGGTLSFSQAGTYDLRSASLGVEFLSAGDPGVVLVVDSEALIGKELIYGPPGSKLVTPDSTLNLFGTLGDQTVESTNATGTTFVVSYIGNALRIFGGPGSDTIETSSFVFTAAERDEIFNSSSIEIIHDPSGFYGDDTANTITGTIGHDSIFGGAGNDTLIGLAGSDTLTGNSGDDLFVFANGWGDVDSITDFVAGGSTDEIDISDFNFANFAAVAAAAMQIGADTRIQLDADDVVTLIGVQKTALTADDFVL